MTIIARDLRAALAAAVSEYQEHGNIGELLHQVTCDLGGTVECGEMAVREEARGLLLPTAIFARWCCD